MQGGSLAETWSLDISHYICTAIGKIRFKRHIGIALAIVLGDET
jgi:hypothetical protein